jgi:hypothetical protein
VLVAQAAHRRFDRAERGTNHRVHPVREKNQVSNTEVDKQVLAATFAARVSLAKLSEEEAVGQAKVEWQKTQKWVASESHREGSFLWFCDDFDLDPSAVRRAIKEKRK